MSATKREKWSEGGCEGASESERRGEKKRREKRWAGQGYSGVKEEARPMRPQA